MKKQIQYSFLILFTVVLTTTPILQAAAQQPKGDLSHNTADSLHSVMLDSIVVTPYRTTNLLRKTLNTSYQNSSLDRLITGSELNTSVSGVTKDLQRDLPSMVRIYTPQGIPLLTKYTSNNALTSTIPDSAVRLELKEPSAKFPNPDAPVIMQPDYRLRRSILLSPLKQTMGITSGTQHPIAAGLSLTHSGASKTLQKLVPELQAYNTTYSAYGALRADFSKSRAEVIAHHSQSENEYGGLLGIEQLQETDKSTNIFVNTQRSFGDQTLHAGVAHQTGREHRTVEELDKKYKVINEVKATTFTAALSRNNTIELRAIYHDLQRVYTFGREDSVHMQRLETLLTHRQSISSDAHFTMEARFDHQDKEPSISAELLLQADKSFLISLNAGHLYDAVGSEALNSLMNSVQIDPHPWTTRYAQIGASFHHEQINFNASVMNKIVQRGWYGKSSTIEGWIGRFGANGILQKERQDNFYIAWSLEGVARSLTLDIPDLPSRVMPGPARLEGHASVEISTGKMKYLIQMDTFTDRRMRITEGMTGNLGSQHFLALGISRIIHPIKLGVTLNNTLAFLGKENRIVAHFNKKNDMRFVHAPPIIDLSIGIKF